MSADIRPVNKGLSLFSLVMMNVVTVASLRALTASAEYGFSLLFFYGVGAIFFFIPSALVSAELATGWPSLGGSYVWVREAFGSRCGFVSAWIQWICTIVWYPVALTFISAMIAHFIGPELAESKYYVFTCVLVLFWGATLLNCFGIEISSWVSTMGALFGTIFPMIVIMVLGLWWMCTGHPRHIEISYHHLFPQNYSLHYLSYALAIIFGLIGMEVSAVHACDVVRPEHNYPKAQLYSALIILFTLVFSSLSVGIVVPPDQLSLVSGIGQALAIFGDAYGMHWLAYLTLGLIVIGALAGLSTWLIGPTRGLLAAGQDHFLPSLFHYVNKKDAPVGLLLVQAVIVSILTLLFLLMPAVNGSYWVLTALASQLNLLFYIIFFAAAIRLRYKHAHRPRAYKIPGGKTGIWLVGISGIVICTLAILLGFLPPSDMQVGNLFVYESILFGGILFFCVLPLFFLHGKVEGVQERTLV
ncbi:APC family permease [Pajaroellobacter abortibovis]|uniref:Transporter n=1 Tax=Pajaroellobacter abortibovis TaxID=1882918 RepID=A0A1L6MXT2_9BACT|nr:APC family permease [Pajaroellobacter abortibovis]APS00292.1 hypothetical protein BCY86_06045 [Pajaroellobacter abortibovis]